MTTQKTIKMNPEIHPSHDFPPLAQVGTSSVLGLSVSFPPLQATYVVSSRLPFLNISISNI